MNMAAFKPYPPELEMAGLPVLMVDMDRLDFKFQSTADSSAKAQVRAVNIRSAKQPAPDKHELDHMVSLDGLGW